MTEVEKKNQEAIERRRREEEAERQRQQANDHAMWLCIIAACS